MMHQRIERGDEHVAAYDSSVRSSLRRAAARGAVPHTDRAPVAGGEPFRPSVIRKAMKQPKHVDLIGLVSQAGAEVLSEKVALASEEARVASKM